MEVINKKLNVCDYTKKIITNFTNNKKYTIMKNDLINLINTLKDKYNKNNFLIKNILHCVQYKLNVLKFKKLNTLINTLKIKEQIKKNKSLYKVYYDNINNQIELIDNHLKIFSLNEKPLKININLVNFYQKYLKFLKFKINNKISNKEEEEINNIIKLKQREINYTKEFIKQNYIINNINTINNFEFLFQYDIIKKSLINKKMTLKNKQNHLTKFFFKNKYLVILLENNVNNIITINHNINKYKDYHDFYLNNTIENTEFLQETIYQKELELNDLNKKIYYLH